MKTKTSGFKFSIEHIDGKKNTFTDTLSRYPAGQGDDEDKELEEELNVCSIVSSASCASEGLIDTTDLKNVANDDKEYQTLLHKVRNNTFAPKKRDEDDNIKQYHAVRDRISI